ncbi:VWA domain-containing protein, partial [Acidobacteriota bacterium]
MKIRGEYCTRCKYIFIVLGIVVFFILDVYPFRPFCSQKIDDQEDIQEEVTVTLKLIQVYVTDKEGNPVTDLEMEDFELKDNGKIKSISDFERHVLSIPKEEIAPQLVEKNPKAPPKLSRKFLLFFDFTFNNPGGILDARNAALHFLDSGLQSTDEVGVISFSANKGLAFHEFMTTNHQKVRDVVLGFGAKGVLGRADDIERRYYRKLLEIQQIADVNEREGEVSLSDIREKKRKEAEARSLKAERIEFKQKVLTLMNSVIDLAKTLNYIPGQKHVLYFSSGIPSSILEGAQIDRTMSLSGRILDQGKIANITLIKKHEDMAKELASSNSVVYAMNSGRIPMPLDWEQEIGQRPIIRGDNLENQLTGKASLQQLSQATGGKYFNDIKSYEAIVKELQNVTGSYYILGFYIDEKWDGKYHKIKVSVRREECDVRSQAGYFSPKSFRKYTKLEKLLHFIDLALKEDSLYRTPLTFPLKTLPCTVGKTSTLVMMAKIPGEQVEELLGEKVEIANITFDDKDNVVELTRFEDDFTKLPRADIYFYSLSSLQPGKYRYRVVVRNLETGKSAVSSSPVEIIEAPDQGIKLNPPLLLLPENDAFYLKGSLTGDEFQKNISIGLSDVYPYDRTKFKPVVEGFLQGTPKLIVVLSCVFYNIQNPEIKPFVRLHNKTTGEMSSMNFFILDKHLEEERQFFVLGFPMDTLQRGQYVLDFLAEERTTESRST